MFLFTGPWRAAHIDDLRQTKDIISDIQALQNMTISQMFETNMAQSEGNYLIEVILYAWTISLHSIFLRKINYKLFICSHGGG